MTCMRVSILYPRIEKLSASVKAATLVLTSTSTKWTNVNERPEVIPFNLID
jgi:hypothetical protein